MKKLITLLIMALIIALPVTSALPQTQTNAVASDDPTITVRCITGNTIIEQTLPRSTIQDLIDMGASHQDDFMTIYDKRKSPEEVTLAFENVQPFFQALVDTGLTSKSLDEVNDLYHTIRERIREPRQTQEPYTPPGDGPRTKGLWNGAPTPVWCNAVCGIFDAGFVVGFTLGTHTVIPTIGADLFMTYVFQGASMTIGVTGFTMAVAAFQVLLGFLGVLITTPGIMLGPYFMTGLCGMMFGLGL